VKKQGRDPDDCKVFFLTKPIIGDTDEAPRGAPRSCSNAPVEAAAGRRVDHAPDGPVDYDLDKPLPAAIQTGPSRASAASSIASHVRADADAADIRTRKVSIDSSPTSARRSASADELARYHRRVGGDGFRHPPGHLAGLRRTFRGEVIRCSAAGRRAHGVHGHTCGSTAGVLDGPRAVTSIMALVFFHRREDGRPLAFSSTTTTWPAPYATT